MIVVCGKNVGMNAEPLDERHLDGASRCCLDSLTRVATGLTGLGVRPPTVDDETVTEFVGGFLAGGKDGDRAAWVLVDGAEVAGFVGVTFVELATDGYVGLTSVTGHRGTGTGRALVDAALRWSAEERVGSEFLHYVVDNPLSARFWMWLGFRPHIHTDGLWL